MLDDQRIEGQRVFQRAGQGLCVGDRVASVGEGDCAGLLQQAHFDDLIAVGVAGHGSVGKHLDELHIARASGDEFEDRGVVDYGVGIGQGDHGGHATGGGGTAAALDIFFVFVAGFAEVDPHIHETRGQHRAFAIDNFGTCRCTGRKNIGADRHDPRTIRQDSALGGGGRIKARRRVDHPGVDIGDLAGQRSVRRGAPAGMLRGRPDPRGRRRRRSQFRHPGSSAPDA